MHGKYRVMVENAYVRYEFEITRNITIIRGQSATGKTTLFEMIRSYQEEEESGIINLHHIMEFPGDAFEIEIVNANTIVHNMKELVDVAVDIL